MWHIVKILKSNSYDVVLCWNGNHNLYSFKILLQRQLNKYGGNYHLIKTNCLLFGVWTSRLADLFLSGGVAFFVRHISRKWGWE